MESGLLGRVWVWGAGGGYIRAYKRSTTLSRGVEFRYRFDPSASSSSSTSRLTWMDTSSGLLRVRVATRVFC